MHKLQHNYKVDACKHVSWFRNTMRWPILLII